MAFFLCSKDKSITHSNVHEIRFGVPDPLTYACTINSSILIEENVMRNEKYMQMSCVHCEEVQCHRISLSPSKHELCTASNTCHSLRACYICIVAVQHCHSSKIDLRILSKLVAVEKSVFLQAPMYFCNTIHQSFGEQ
jgi:hypothetical protein